MAGTSVYQMVTDRIIAELEKGVIPWERPWTGVRSGAYNRISKKSYSLLNQMILRNPGEYATYQQWQSIGGQVRKGAKGEMVVFWKMLQAEEENENGEKVKKTVPMLRYYNVFHISQVDGVQPLERAELNELEPIKEAENVLNDYITREGITLERSASNEAYYRSFTDTIHLPLMEQFKNPAEYYSTAFHEAAHSTMKEARCNRPQKYSFFGNEDYSKEEMIAELTSTSLLNIIGIETKHSFRNSVAYIQSWLKVLRNDSRFIVSASGKAEKAVNYILGVEA